MSDQDVLLEGSFEIPVTLEVDADDIEAFTFGVCHDGDFLTLDDAVFTEIVDDIPDLIQSVQIFDGEGYAASKVLALGTVIEPGFSEIVVDATYDVDGESAADGETTTLEFCGTLGDPEVPVQVLVDLKPIEPTLEDATITMSEAPPAAIFSLCHLTKTYVPDEDAPPAVVTFFIEGNSKHPDHPLDSDGFQFGVEHDGDVLEAVEIRTFAILDDLNGGGGPFFYSANVEPELPDGVTGGVTVLCVYDLSGDEKLAFDDRTEILEIEYSILVDPEDLEGKGATELEFRDDIGDPAVPTNLVIGSDLVATVTENGSIETVAVEEKFEAGAFKRGDASGDAQVSPLFDAFYLLRFGFSDGPEPPCEVAADVDGDDDLSPLQDAISLFNWGFALGEEPPVPGPFTCGVDGEAELGCATPPECGVIDRCD